jgi:tetratricopeptide (TPR) repeat protein
VEARRGGRAVYNEGGGEGACVPILAPVPSGPVPGSPESTMIGFGWLALRQAQEALKSGLLEEAQRLLAQPVVQGQKRTLELLVQLARAYAERGERNLRRDDPTAAWADLLRAEQTGVSDPTAERLRQALTRLGLAEARALMEAGEPRRAGEVIAQLRDRAVRLPELEPLEEAAKGWAHAREQADRGEFFQAILSVERARRLLTSPSPALQRFAAHLEDCKAKFAGLLVALHEAAQNERWPEVLELSEQVLALAPQHAEARRVRARAWKAVEPATVASAPQRAPAQSQADPAAAPAEPQFLLWIDGVGGYLVCLGSRITLGQATPESTVDIPLFADVSRLHAALTRDPEGYLLEGLRLVQVNGQPVLRALLRSGDRVTLGGCCQLQFRQPVPVSASARLDLASGHRLRLAVDAVLLMADTLVLGPGPQSHVVMPGLKQPVVLFRHKGGLGVRHVGALAVNGRPFRDRATLEPGATASVVGEDFSLTLEPVGRQG